MTTAFDVPPEHLIKALAAKLQALPSVKAPPWAPFAKTGVHREKGPAERDWWTKRTAALLRKVYVEGPVGVERLRAMYGGSRDRGSAPNRARKGSGSILRKALQQLEREGLVENVKGVGRRVTPKGRSLVDDTAHEVKRGLVAEMPALAKY